MHVFKKILLWIFGITGVLMLIVLALGLLLPKILNIDWAKEKVLAEISQRTGVELAFRRIDLTFLPRPKVVIHRVALDIPGTAHGTIEALEIRLRIKPFAGWLAGIADFRMKEPAITVYLSEETDGVGRQAFSFSDIDRKIIAFFASLMPEAQGLAVEIDRGRLHLFAGERPYAEFRELHGRLERRQNTISVEMNCTSNLWENMSLKATMDRGKLEGEGQIKLVDVKPHELMKALLPNALFRVGVSDMDFASEFKINPANGLFVDYRSELSSLAIDHNRNRTVVKGLKLSGSVHINKGNTVLAIRDTTVDYPSLVLAGNLLVDQDSPRFRLELVGREIDVNALRKEILAMTGGNGVLGKIFAIVKGGSIPHLTLKTHGNTIADLGSLKNLLIKGRMVHGEIFIRQADLDLKNVEGDAVIIGGVLNWDKLAATVGNTRGYRGTLKLGLTGGNTPFHLDIMVNVDLVQLPPVLRKFIKDRAFIRELDLISDLNGRARGRLILGETTAQIRARVTVSDFQLSAEYGRMPFIMEIDGGHFSYSGKTISLEEVAVHLGSSSFSGISARIDWTDTPDLNITSGKGRIDLGEIYPWLTSMEHFPLKTDQIRQLNGTIHLTDVKVAGPVRKPAHLRYDVSGYVSDIEAYQDAIAGPIDVTQGSFHATEDATARYLSIEGFRGSVLDNALSLSGNMKDWRDSKRIDFSWQGNLERGSSPEKAIRLRGDLKSLPGSLSLDVDIDTEALNWEDLKKDLAAIVSENPMAQTDWYWGLPMEGLIRFKSKSFTFGSSTWRPFFSEIVLNQGNIEVNILDANLCGISTPGTLKIDHGNVSLDFKPNAKEQQLAPTISCLFNKEEAMTGLFSLAGELTGQGKSEDIGQIIQGRIDLTAHDGRIHSDSVLAKVLTVLNVTEGLWGKLPEIGKEGTGYHSIVIKGRLEKGKMNITEAIVDSDAMNIVGKGEIDIINRELDIILLVAPLKTIDRVVKNIPIVGRILGGSLLSVPVSVTGKMENPTVTALPPSEVGAGMVRMLERILQTPVHIFQSISTANGKPREDSEKIE